MIRWKEESRFFNAPDCSGNPAAQRGVATESGTAVVKKGGGTVPAGISSLCCYLLNLQYIELYERSATVSAET